MEPIEEPQKSAFARWIVPSMPALTFAVVFWLGLIYGPQMINMDGDLCRHLTVGRYILQTWSVPTTDLFSHTMAGKPFVPHEWLSEVLFAATARVAGLNGVVWVTALILAATYTVLTRELRRLVQAPLALAGGFVAAGVGSIHWLPRPHIFTIFFMVVLLATLERYRRRGRFRTLAWLPVMMVVWANLHGGFIAGLILVGLYALGALLERRGRRFAVLMGLLAVLTAVSMIHPAGIRPLANSFSFLNQQWVTGMTVEARSPDFHDPRMWPFAALLIGTLALGWWSTRRLPWTPLVVVAVWGAFGLYAARNIPLFAVFGAWFGMIELDAVVRDRLPGLREEATRISRIEAQTGGWPTVAGAVILGIALTAEGVPVDVRGTGNVFDPQVFPVDAVDSMQTSLPTGHMFNEMMWGGYLLYRLWPQRKVFFDGQTDFYGEALSREYIEVRDGDPHWPDVLDKYGVRWVIVRPDRGLVPELKASGRWKQVLGKGVAVVWVRTGS